MSACRASTRAMHANDRFFLPSTRASVLCAEKEMLTGIFCRPWCHFWQARSMSWCFPVTFFSHDIDNINSSHATHNRIWKAVVVAFFFICLFVENNVLLAIVARRRHIFFSSMPVNGVITMAHKSEKRIRGATYIRVYWHMHKGYQYPSTHKQPFGVLRNGCLEAWEIAYMALEYGRTQHSFHIAIYYIPIKMVMDMDSVMHSLSPPSFAMALDDIDSFCRQTPRHSLVIVSGGLQG